MNKITRRAALAAIPAVGLAPIASASDETVHPMERLRALHDEASLLMHAFNDQMGGRWELRIRASGCAVPVIYKNLMAGSTPDGVDPLLDLIRGYRAAMQAYNASPIDLDDEDNPDFPGFAERYHRLCNEPPMALTMTGAIEAVRLVVEEEDKCGNQPDLTIRVLLAALAYFDSEV